MIKNLRFTVILILAVLTLFTFLYFCKKSELTALNDTKDADTVYFLQNDESWKDDKLGKSTFTLGDSGCLTSCIASVLCMQNIKLDDISEINPQTLNKLFSENDVYDAEGNIQWEKAENVLSLSVTRQDEISAEELEELINNGVYPIVRVKMGSMGNTHYVLLTGIKNHEFMCMDSLNSEKECVSLKKFGNKIYAVRYITIQ